MDTVKFNEAINIYNSGNKQQAETLFADIVKNDTPTYCLGWISSLSN